jgi:hypothetical protein
MTKRIRYLLNTLLLLAGAGLVADPALLGSSPVAAQRADDLGTLLQLGGIWEDERAGMEVRIVQTGRDVKADYLEERFCEHRNGGGGRSHTTQDFFGKIQGNKIVGQMTSCKYGSADAGYIWAPTELGIAPDGDRLIGHWFNASANRKVQIIFRKLAGEPGAACRDPSSWPVARQDFSPFNSQTPADIAPSCEGCSGGIWQFRSGDIVDWKADLGDTPVPHVQEPYKILHSCIYKFEATWACTTTGEVKRTTKRKKVPGRCPPLG